MSSSFVKYRNRYYAAISGLIVIFAVWAIQHILLEKRIDLVDPEFSVRKISRRGSFESKKALPSNEGALIKSLFSSERRSVNTTVSDDPARLKKFEKSYKALEKLEGVERSERFLNLLAESSMLLSLDDFKTFCEGFSNIDDSQTGLIYLGKRFATENPEKGFEWLGGFPDDGAATQAFRQFGANLPIKYADELIAFAISHNNTSRASELLMSFGTSITDLPVALKIVETANLHKELSGGWHDNVGKLLLGFLSQGNVDEALQVATHIQDPGLRTEAYSQLVRSLSAKSPSEAAKIVENLPAGPDQTQTIPFVANSWARLDPDEASAWILSLPPSEAKDAANKSVSSTLLNLYPEYSLAWAMNIASVEQRNQQISLVLDYAKKHFPTRYEQLSKQAGQKPD